MTWDSNHWDMDLRTFYQELIKLRRTSPTLIEAGCQTRRLVDENPLAYMRDTEEADTCGWQSRFQHTSNP